MKRVFSSTNNYRVLVLGLGNPLLGDDGFGWRVAKQLQQELEGISTTAEVDYLAVGGLRLMERLIGYDYAIIIDTMVTGQHPPGKLHCFSVEDLPDPIAGHCSSAHDITLQTAFCLGRALGLSLPNVVLIVGVESQPVFDFTEDFTPPVAAAVPQAVHHIRELLRPFVEKEQLP